MKSDHDIAAMLMIALILTLIAMLLIGEFILCFTMIFLWQNLWLSLAALALFLFSCISLSLWLKGD